MTPAKSGGGSPAGDVSVPDVTGPPEAASASAAAVSANPALAETDAIDALIAEQLQDWQPLVQPVLDAARELRQRCGSDAEMLVRLPEVISKMNMEPLAAAMSKAMFASYLAGMAGTELVLVGPLAGLARDRLHGCQIRWL
ncbi:MAG: DUF935 family protein [Alphaproteobacteria bacterium]|nr:DUF935 family protein [Alphaproteobacteria bacterium]